MLNWILNDQVHGSRGLQLIELVPVPVVVFLEGFVLQPVLLHVPVSPVPGSILHLPVPVPVLLSTVQEM